MSSTAAVLASSSSSSLSAPRASSSPALSPTATANSSATSATTATYTHNGAVHRQHDVRFTGLSPASAALARDAHAAVNAQSSDSSALGSLRIRIVQVTDLPTLATAADHSSASSGSWLRYSGRRHSSSAKARADAAAGTGMICMLLKVTGSSNVLATTSVPSAPTIFWNEEFVIDHVRSQDEFQFFCVDRTKNEPYANLPLREDIAACAGFIGKVLVPLSRLPESEEIEQWYPLVSKATYLSLRTALRLALCFTPYSDSDTRMRHDSTTQLLSLRQRTAAASLAASSSSATSSSTSPTKLRIQIPQSPQASSQLLQSPAAIRLPTGVVDYVIVVGAANANAGACTGSTSSQPSDSALLFRYPALDRPKFPLPTKIEWFCFPGGAKSIKQLERPRSRLFSFVLVGGDDGLLRTYAVCLTVYHRASLQDDDGGGNETKWIATCIAFLTRVPLVEALELCLLAVAHAWLASQARRSALPPQPIATLLVDVCHRILVPIRGVFGVCFRIGLTRIGLVLPATASIYATSSPSTKRASLTFSPTKSPTTNVFNIQQGLEPLVYSLATVFALFDIKTVIHLVLLLLCEYRILLHSTQFALLCPVAESLCALIYPFRWQHPYVPILPHVLAEYLQAPLPYVLGVHTSWLSELMENGRPEHLVIVDIDRGTLQVVDGSMASSTNSNGNGTNGPLLPSRLTKGLHARLKRILYPDPFDDACVDACARPAMRWNASIEKQVRVEFVCYLAAMLVGYRDCLFFVNHHLPVFNKRRYFATCVRDVEVVPFVTKLFCTQAFQSFLETHSAVALSVFHSVYLTFSRTKDLEWPLAMPLLAIASTTTTTTQASWTRSCLPSVETPVFTMPATTDASDADVDDKRVAAAATAAPNSQDATTHDDATREVQPPATAGDDPQQLQDASTLGAAIEALLDAWPLAAATAPFTIDASDLDVEAARVTSCDVQQVARAIDVDVRLLEDHAALFRDPHDVNQRIRVRHPNATSNSSNGPSTNARSLSNDDERTEQVLHKCLTSVFASDEMSTSDDVRICELRFKQQYARDLFVLILMQPSHQYVEMNNSSAASTSTATGGSTWYNPKGSGNCIGEPGFQILTRLAATLMSQCAIHEDFTNARGMLQVAFQYYHFVEDKHSGIGFAKKEYLVTSLRLQPICRSLDMWQHAFTRELDAAIQADPTAGAAGASDASFHPNVVADELFFSLIGSLVYDMLSVDVPLPKVHSFVSVMCSTYQKAREMRATLKQLVDNVFRALELSQDAAVVPTTTLPATAAPTSGRSIASAAPSGDASSGQLHASRQYDLDTVIRRKMSTTDVLQPPLHAKSLHGTASAHSNNNSSSYKSLSASASSSLSSMSRRRAASAAAAFPCTVLSSLNAPIVSMDVHQGRVACGLVDASITLVETSCPDKRIKLEGHTDAVVAVQLRGSTLVSGSRDHTLRAWDLRATPKRRQLFSFIASVASSVNVTSSSSQRQSLHDYGGNSSSSDVDGACVSKKSVVWRGHTAAISCLEMGRQLATDRSIIGSGSDDGTIRLWDTAREQSVALLGNGRAGVSCLRFLPLYGYLVSGCREHSLKVWDLTESKLRTNTQAHRGAIVDIQITGDRLVTASNDRIVKVWDAHFRSGQHYVHALRGHGGPVQCVSLGGPADPNICTGASDGVVRVWDLRYVQKGPRLALTGHTGQITCLQRDFTKLVSGSEDGSIRVWDMHSGVCIKDIRAHMSGVTRVVLRDSVVYSSSWDGSVRMWDIDAANLSLQRT